MAEDLPQMIDAARRGDAAAFEALYDRFGAASMRSVGSCGDSRAAEMLVQQTPLSKTTPPTPSMNLPRTARTTARVTT